MEQLNRPTDPDPSINMPEVTFNAIKSKLYLVLKNPLIKIPIANDEVFYVQIKEEERQGMSAYALQISRYFSKYSFQYILKSCGVDYVG